MQRRHRLRSASDFALLREKGKRYHHALLVLVVRPNGGSSSRFGFSASRQVGKAVERNRTKRLMRESVRYHYERIQGGWDCLFVARRSAAEATLDQFMTAVYQTLERAKLLNDERQSWTD
jgi:ribonuclease P protein component